MSLVCLVSSYEGLKKTLYELQTRLLVLTGQDPVKDKPVGPQLSPPRTQRNVQNGEQDPLFECALLCYWRNRSKHTQLDMNS